MWGFFRELQLNPMVEPTSTEQPVSLIAQDTRNREVITLGQYALVTLPSDGLKMVDLRESGIVSLGKFGLFKVENIIGYPWGLTFEILEDYQVRPIKLIDEEIELTRDDLTKLFSENNQNIIDVGSLVQKLSNEDIAEIKRQGALSAIGQQIIEQMIAGHGGFDKKTIHSQQKYLKRKQLKFMRRFTVDFVGANELLKYYQDKGMIRVLDLSMELLGMLLLYANVQPGGEYFVMDDTGGVLTYAILERLQGRGMVFLAHENEYPNLSGLKYANLSPQYTERMVKTLNWLQIVEPEAERLPWVEYSAEEIAELKGSKRSQYFKRRARTFEVNDNIDRLLAGNFDAMISATTLYLPTLWPLVIDYIGGSQPIVLYNQHKEVLMLVQAEFTRDKRVLALSIFELRVIPFQTIPGRMHPVMTMRGFGGYVLWGTKVIPNAEGVAAVGRGLLKRKREETESAPTLTPTTVENTPEL